MPRAKSTDLRRKGRIVALQSLYAADIAGSSEESSLVWLAEEDQLPVRATGFAQKLLQGVASNCPVLDDIIQQYAPAWPVAQLSPVDRNILRIALFELLHSVDTPPKTAVNEAVELAKVFGSESSGRFVNGVLGSVMAGLEATDLAAVGPPL
mgnify:CR=1 FL=1